MLCTACVISNAILRPMSQLQRRRTPKPRTWIADPAARQFFGRVQRVEWKTPMEADGDQTVLIKAAKMQHLVAVHVRRYSAKRHADGHEDWALTALAGRLTTVDYDGLMRVLRGDVHMNLLHVMDLSQHFGPLVRLGEEVVRAS